nr:hypothetical protein [Parolsenella massiliensis]
MPTPAAAIPITSKTNVAATPRDATPTPHDQLRTTHHDNAR